MVIGVNIGSEVGLHNFVDHEFVGHDKNFGMKDDNFGEIFLTLESLIHVEVVGSKVLNDHLLLMLSTNVFCFPFIGILNAKVGLAVLVKIWVDLIINTEYHCLYVISIVTDN